MRFPILVLRDAHSIRLPDLPSTSHTSIIVKRALPAPIMQRGNVVSAGVSVRRSVVTHYTSRLCFNCVVCWMSTAVISTKLHSLCPESSGKELRCFLEVLYASRWVGPSAELSSLCCRAATVAT